MASLSLARILNHSAKHMAADWVSVYGTYGSSYTRKVPAAFRYKHRDSVVRMSSSRSVVLVVVRHGQATHNLPTFDRKDMVVTKDAGMDFMDSPLTDLGQKQAT